ncbi:hypothetical protein FEU46_22435 [Escherichia coli]|nr:hypothetical protein [Escherichia coli]EEW1712173.1 hypothetical protein [Escherichia coli]EFA5500866.1 hypothetical protein [Escherichia coli]EFB3074954.1 hypothetical protein [Escherichia coli]EFB6143319.1 hypothetical protein [Escherichia coli]
MLPSETMIWQPEFTDKTLSRKPGAVHTAYRRCRIFDLTCFVTGSIHKRALYLRTFCNGNNLLVYICSLT